MKDAEHSLEGTVGAALAHLLPRLGRRSARACPSWPPDLFAVVASVLDRSGAYVHIVNHWPIDAQATDGDWRARIDGVAADWLRRLGRPAADWPAYIFGDKPFRVKPPPDVEAWWAVVCAAWDLPMEALRRNADPALLEALLGLLAAADEVCPDVGVSPEGGPVVHLAKLVLQQRKGRTLCREVHPQKARVLPKQHTPQRGLTLRSLSVHLALAAASDLDPVWSTFPGVAPRAGLNVLLLPWPLAVEARQFKPFLQPDHHRCALPDPYGFFRFEPRIDPEDVAARVKDVLDRAQRLVGDIDMVVLPELALTVEAFDRVRAEVLTANPNMLLLSGVWGRADGDTHPSNHLSVSVPVLWPDDAGTAKSSTFPITQRKHHRWCLDRTQIIQYGLGASLTATRLWWEHSEVSARELNFVTVHEWLTFCPLICEDLARQDPAADVIRSVGPNLVIALLMDGPQLPSRWPGRYASVLAEDPGSSVLTLTSLGMSTLSRPAPGHPPKHRVVGLWRDAVYGEQPLELPDGADALVLSIAPELREEWTADGRRDGGAASFPVFRGVRPVPV